MTKTLQLSEGAITLRALTPDEIKHLRAIEVANIAAPGMEIAFYMPLIQAALSDIETQRVAPDLQTLLGFEDSTSLWRIIRTIYELSGVEFPAEFAGKCEGSSLG